MQVFQTAGVPPKRGKIILAIIGWMRNNSVALTNIVTANNQGKDESPLEVRHFYKKSYWTTAFSGFVFLGYVRNVS